jgi:hypothetical protein
VPRDAKARKRDGAPSRLPVVGSSVEEITVDGSLFRTAICAERPIIVMMAATQAAPRPYKGRSRRSLSG